MAVFTLDLSESDRAALEAHRVRLGARSHAEAIRRLIRGTGAVGSLRPARPDEWPDVEYKEPFRTPIPKAEAMRRAGVVAPPTVRVGPEPVKPGSRLKKDKR